MKITRCGILWLTAMLVSATPFAHANLNLTPAEFDNGKSSTLFVGKHTAVPAMPQQANVLHTNKAVTDNLAEPNLDNEALLNWAKDAILAPYNYNYEAYTEQLTYAAHFFTPDAWKKFQPSLKQFGTEEAFLKRKGTVQARITGKIMITKKGVLHNRYTWQVAAPISIFYRDVFKSRRQSVLAVILITRIEKKRIPSGLVVAHYQSTIRSLVRNDYWRLNNLTMAHNQNEHLHSYKSTD